jgi:hypothetical protein
MTTWSILLLLEIFYDHLVYSVVIWYNFPRFGILYLEKSGNPDLDPKLNLLFKTYFKDGSPTFFCACDGLGGHLLIVILYPPVACIFEKRSIK